MNEQEVSDNFPSHHDLGAALEVGGLVSSEPVDRTQLRNSFTNHASGGIFTSMDLIAGQRVLEHVHLLESDGPFLRSTSELEDLKTLPKEEGLVALLAILLARTRPPWLSVSTSGGAHQEQLAVAWEWVPTVVLEVLETTVPDPDRREAVLLASALTVDPEFRSTLGRLGEAAVADECRDELVGLGRSDLANEVRVLSTISDQLGYDVTAPRVDGSTRRIEVKTTMALGPPYRVYLSRNEAAVGLRDPDWTLVLCRSSDAGESTIGWCAGAALAVFLPTDHDPRGRWQSVRIDLPEAVLAPGIPAAQV